MSWTLLADGVVAILLVATIVYVRRFSKHITAIRDSRSEFEKLIGDLTKSTDQAASHLHQFKVTAEVAGRDLQARVERTQGLTTEFGKIGDDLKLLTERAESAAGRLEAVIAKSRHIAAASAPAPIAAVPPAPAVELSGGRGRPQGGEPQRAIGSKVRSVMRLRLLPILMFALAGTMTVKVGSVWNAFEVSVGTETLAQGEAGAPAATPAGEAKPAEQPVAQPAAPAVAGEQAAAEQPAPAEGRRAGGSCGPTGGHDARGAGRSSIR